MKQLVDVRITVIGPENAARRFEDSKWRETLRARHIELYEFSEGRRVWWFQTGQLSDRRFAKLSIQWPNLTILADYEDRTQRIKGLIKAKAGNIDRCLCSY